jgi:hypothetical protein
MSIVQVKGHSPPIMRTVSTIIPSGNKLLQKSDGPLVKDAEFLGERLSNSCAARQLGNA